MWEGKVFAAADTDAAETDWKHKVTPERGDLIKCLRKWIYQHLNELHHQNKTQVKYQIENADQNYFKCIIINAKLII